jgi:serine/threonine protein kinase
MTAGRHAMDTALANQYTMAYRTRPRPSAARLLALCARFARRTSARKFGPYILGAQIGTGNMGAVYSARHDTLGHRAALKVLHPERSSARERSRFAREVELTRRLAHPNTVSILDSGLGPDGVPYFAMEYVEGIDLETLVEREGPLPAARVIGILSQVSAALSCAHVAGIVHRDVKPANIMVALRGAEYHVKLVDFGLAQSQAAGETLTSDAGTIAGTPLYLAPEAITAPDAIDPRSDLYALGAVGYFLLTGQHVFGGSTLIELCSKHLYEVPVAPSQRSTRAIPEALDAIVLACLAKSPSARPASAAALQSALLACSEHAPSDVALSSAERASNVELEAFAATLASTLESHPVLRSHVAAWRRASTGSKSSWSIRRAHAHANLADRSS